MFSYCQNNPAVCIDNGGQFPIWLALFMDHAFGFIHRLVQMDIRLKHAGEGISIEQGLYLGDKSVARADVVDLDSGEIWEIKTVKSGRGAALDQLERYFKSNLKVSEKGPRAIPGGSGMFPGRFSGSFPLICGNEACGIDTYYVIYYTPEPGVILYDVRKAMLTQEEFANAKVYVPKFARQTSLAYSGTPTYATYAKYALGTACFAGACYCGYKLCEALLGCLMVACLA